MWSWYSYSSCDDNVNTAQHINTKLHTQKLHINTLDNGVSCWVVKDHRCSHLKWLWCQLSPMSQHKVKETNTYSYDIIFLTCPVTMSPTEGSWQSSIHILFCYNNCYIHYVPKKDSRNVWTRYDSTDFNSQHKTYYAKLICTLYSSIVLTYVHTRN